MGAKKVLVITTQICCAIVLLSLFGLGASQLGANTATARTKMSDDACTAQGVIYDHRPLAFKINKDTDDLYCPWFPISTNVRMCVTIFAAVCNLGFVYALVKKKSGWLWFSILFLTAQVLACFVMMGFDSDAVRKANTFCQDGLPGTAWAVAKVPIDCSPMMRFTATCLVDALALLFTCANLFVSWKWNRMWREQDEKEEDNSPSTSTSNSHTSIEATETSSSSTSIWSSVFSKSNNHDDEAADSNTSTSNSSSSTSSMWSSIFSRNNNDSSSETPSNSSNTSSTTTSSNTTSSRGNAYSSNPFGNRHEEDDHSFDTSFVDSTFDKNAKSRSAYGQMV